MSKTTFKKIQAKSLAKRKAKIAKKYGHLEQQSPSRNQIERVEKKELRAKRKREERKTLYPIGFEYKDRQSKK